jgi:putative endopeptidase
MNVTKFRYFPPAEFYMKATSSLSLSKFVFACTALVALAGFAQNAGIQEVHGIQVNNMDRSVKPGDDFYRYCNGGWLKRTEIPPDRVAVNVFTELSDLGNKRTADLIQEIAKSNPPAGSGQRKVADLYNSFTEEAGIEKKGLAPIRPHLDAIAAIRDKKQLARALGETLRADVDPLNVGPFHTANLFGMWAAPGFHDPEHETPYLLQGGIGMPDREYYLSDSEHMKQLRGEYQGHLAAMLKLAGFSDADGRAARIVELEHAIAQTHRSLADNEDIHKADNTWSRADFSSNAPGLDWAEYFDAAGLGNVEQFIVWQPEAFKGEAALVTSTPLETWKDWLASHLIDEYASVLPKPLAEEHFAFFGKAMAGAEQQRPRWQRGVVVVNDLLGDIVGQAYAKKYFPPQAKAEAEAMVAKIIDAFHQRIEALQWMNPSTKKEAETKLAALYVGIGYPETWHNYSNFEVRPDDIFGNMWRGSLARYQRQVARLGKTVDRKEWAMTPQTVNAVNLPLQNALNFPAAILQPPFYDPQAPAAVNFGAIGAVIGHEVSHTFDTEGSTVDATGRLRKLVDAGRSEAFRSSHRCACGAIRHVQAFSGFVGEWEADSGGGHRRPGRSFCGLRWLSSFARGKNGAGAGWIHRRSAVLYRLWAELGIERTRSCLAPASDDRCARSRGISGRDCTQCGRMVRITECAAGGEVVPAAE